MEAVIAVFALLFLLFVGLGAYATVKAVGAAKRGVDRTIEQARRTVEDHTLRAKSIVQIGPAAEIAELRLQLRTSMRATQDALRTGAAEDESLKESLGLFERLSAHGHQLDADLRRLEAEPDRAEVTARLAELRGRTERITKSANSLRRAVRDRERRFTDDDLGALSDQIDIEADALRHWTPAGPAQEQQWPDAPAAEDRAAQHTQSWAAGRRPAQEPAPQAITPPSRRPAYPWQKKPRPESTA
ncbi:hypothetical protein A6P39_027675 [Streptomyces sp. FXJ1.172]|uniref:hypothetical protein n=1 Tax=Streptomyces sp. FXJ1.172 TaxID=710705 RepID=UPI0007D01247|nr:hypothetical protein [Streptomyces sp. FXJ1.172]WEO97491.1 hypothetical protein A6P39_027675 [Streptomyces sp. FXJ1.172]